jgi:hypothetical protein
MTVGRSAAASIPTVKHDGCATERPSTFYDQGRMNPRRTRKQIDLTNLSTESDQAQIGVKGVSAAKNLVDKR